MELRLQLNGLADTRIAMTVLITSGILHGDSGAEGITIRNALGDLQVGTGAGRWFELIF